MFAKPTTAYICVLTLSLCGACSRTPAKAATNAASAAPAAAPGAAQRVSGVVLETMDASNYTYVRVKTDSGELWAAASQFKVAVGDTVALSLDQPMEHFHSQTLNRDFDRIYFVSRIGGDGAAPPVSMAVAHPTQSAAPDVSPARVAVATQSAPGATTVAAVWKTKASLVGKRVTVRGKVVKYNGGILGLNWIHIQDGTGNAADGSNDITVTSEAESKVGETIAVTGTVAVNKDLGAGYNFPVIIEHATILPK